MPLIDSLSAVIRPVFSGFKNVIAGIFPSIDSIFIIILLSFLLAWLFYRFLIKQSKIMVKIYIGTLILLIFIMA